MKIIFILLSLLVSLYASQETEKFDMLLKHYKNIEVPSKIGYAIYTPFERAKKIIKMRQKEFSPPHARRLRLETILNSRAFINGKWYNQHDFIDGYKISRIYKERVLLIKGKKSKILQIPKHSHFIHVKKAFQ